MDRESYRRRAAEPNLPTLMQRIAALEVAQKAWARSVQKWCREKVVADMRWRETHSASHEAMQDHIYALDEKLRRLE